MSEQVWNEGLGTLLDSVSRTGAEVIHEGRRLPLRSLAEESRRVAAGLVDLGVRPGDRVGLWLPNVPQWLTLFFACARVGAIAVSVNTRFRSKEVGDIVGGSGCRVLAFQPGFKGIDFTGILKQVPPQAVESLEHVVLCGQAEADDIRLPGGRVLRATAYDRLDASPALEEDIGGPDDACLIFTTSGTTSAPKFVLHKQSAIAGHARAAARGHGYTAEGTCLLQILPLCGAFGHAQALASLAAGRPMVLQTAFDAREAVSLCQRHHVTNFNASDEMIARMLEATDAAHPLPDLRFCGFARFSGIAGLVKAAARRGVYMRGLFGMSETQALLALQPEDDPQRYSRGGGLFVSEQTRVRARDPGTGGIQPHDETGEIELCGPSLMLGYYRNPEATEKAFTEDGYLRTGDVGYTTPDGGFVFTTRIKDVLRLGGFLVAPAEIEAYLEDHPAVRACAVVAGANAHARKAVAFVVSPQGEVADEAELLDYCRRGLAKFKVPGRIFVLEKMPSVPSPNGAKIRRNLLREWAVEWTRDDA